MPDARMASAWYLPVRRLDSEWTTLPRVRRLILAFAIVGLSLLPGQALADHDGTFVDPDSVEYAIPFESAREHGSAGANSTSRTGSGGRGHGAEARNRGPAPLFGAGIGPPQSGAPASDAGSATRGGSAGEGAEGNTSPGRSSGDADPGNPGEAADQRNERGDDATPPLSSEASTSTGIPFSNPWVIGVAALVLSLGALAGIVGRKRRSAST